MLMHGIPRSSCRKGQAIKAGLISYWLLLTALDEIKNSRMHGHKFQHDSLLTHSASKCYCYLPAGNLAVIMQEQLWQAEKAPAMTGLQSFG